MAEIIATFNTTDKTLSVSMDGKKMKNISEVNFFVFGDNAGAEIRTVESKEDDDIVTITKILANENGEEVTETINNGDLTQALSERLFPNKFNNGV